MTYPQQPVYYVPVVQRPPMCGLAVAGFVFSLAWGFGFLSPIGLVLSLLAIAQIKRNPGMRGSALAGWGIALGVLGCIWLGMWIYGFATAAGTGA